MTNVHLRKPTPLWALGMSAALVALGLGRAHRGSASPRADDQNTVEAKAGISFGTLRRTYIRFSRHRITTVAAGVTFFSLLAIFPAIAALVAMYGFFFEPDGLAGQVQSLEDILPSGAVEVVSDQMQRVTSQGRSVLSLTLVGSLAISLWSANSGMKAMFDALNIVHNAEETRSFVRLNAISLLFTLGGIVFVLLALAALVVLPAAFAMIGLAGGMPQILAFGRWPLLLIVLMLALAVVFRFGPSREHAKWRWITWGSATSAVLWLAASVLFSWYAQNYGNFNRTYGTLGAAIGFMMWMWISAMVILVGAELDAELECQDQSTSERPNEDRSG